MRQLNQNKQKMWYANYQDNTIYDSDGNKLVNHEGDIIVSHNPNYPDPTEPIYAYDENGQPLVTVVDGVEIPVESETVTYYEAPTIFYANISFDNGNTVLAEYGLDTSNYNAVISANKGVLPFDERTIIWHKSKPEVDDYGRAKEETADYRVVAIKTSLNEERFFLKKRVDD